MPRNQHEIRADLSAAQAKYNEVVHAAPASTVREASQKIKTLHKELSDCLTVGAEPCEGCGGAPIGLRHIHGQGQGVDSDGKPIVAFSHSYEVGCLACGNKRAIVTTPQETNGADLDQYADETIARAVKRWNDEKYRPSKAKPSKV